MSYLFVYRCKCFTDKQETAGSAHAIFYMQHATRNLQQISIETYLQSILAK